MDLFRYSTNDLTQPFDQGWDQQQQRTNDLALRQSGQQLAQTGSFSAPANALFQVGNIEGGAKVEDQLQQAQQRQAIAAQKQQADHLAFLGKAADYLSQIPDDGGQQTARRQALTQFSPVLQQMGFKPQEITQLQSADLSDTALNAFKSKVKMQVEKIGNNLVAVNPDTLETKTVYQGDPEQKHDWKEVTNADGSTSFIDLNAPQAASAGSPQATSGAAGGASTPRSQRNNNPVNVTNLPNGQKWAGQTGSDGQYAVFDTPQSGMTAADHNLQAYATQHGINTLSGVVNRWAPKAGGNDPAAYIKTVAADLGIDPNAPLDLNDPQVRQSVLQSMSKVESGLGNGPQGAQPQQPTQGGRIAGSAPGTKELKGNEQDEAALTKDAVDLLAGRYLRDGSIPPMGMGKNAAANRTAILNRATDLAKGLGLDAGDLVAGTVGTKAAAAALNKATTIRSQVEGSEATVNANAQQVLSLAGKGAGPTGIPVLNRWIQAGRKNIAGDPDVAAFNLALGTVADEYAKVMTTNTGTGGTTSDSARQEAYRRLDGAMTVPQLQSVIKQMQIEMSNRANSLRDVESGLRNQLRSGPGGAQPAPAGGSPPPPPANRPPLSAIFGR